MKKNSRICDSHFIGGNCNNKAEHMIIDGCGYPLYLCKKCYGDKK